MDRAISNIDAFIRGARSACVLSCDLVGSSATDDDHDVSGHKLVSDVLPFHEFKVGWKVEAINPQKPYLVQPATIVKVTFMCLFRLCFR